MPFTLASVASHLVHISTMIYIMHSAGVRSAEKGLARHRRDLGKGRSMSTIYIELRTFLYTHAIRTPDKLIRPKLNCLFGPCFCKACQYACPAS